MPVEDRGIELFVWCRNCRDVHPLRFGPCDDRQCPWSLTEVDPECIPMTCPGCGRYVDVIPCESGEWVVEEHATTPKEAS
jgi:hypothetical protein